MTWRGPPVPYPIQLAAAIETGARRASKRAEEGPICFRGVGGDVGKNAKNKVST